MRPIAVTQRRSPAARCRLDLILVETHPHGGRQRPPTIQPELEALVRILLGWDGDAPLVMFTTSFNWRVSAQLEGSRTKPTWPNEPHAAGAWSRCGLSRRTTSSAGCVIDALLGVSQSSCAYVSDITDSFRARGSPSATLAAEQDAHLSVPPLCGRAWRRVRRRGAAAGPVLQSSCHLAAQRAVHLARAQQRDARVGRARRRLRIRPADDGRRAPGARAAEAVGGAGHGC